jgi:hypothetical protein
MAWIFKNRADIEDFFAAVTGGSETFYSWFVDHTPSLLPAPLNGSDFRLPQSNTELQFFQSGADVQFILRGIDAPANVPMPALGITGHAALSGTPGADVFALDIGTVMAAVAPVPTLVEISGYSAAQGDVVDVSAVLRGSYAPLTADSAQVRLTEAASNAFATLDLNVSTAQSPHWVALAKLDGAQAGDTVNVVLDASHTVALLA